MNTAWMIVVRTVRGILGFVRRGARERGALVHGLLRAGVPSFNKVGITPEEGVSGGS